MSTMLCFALLGYGLLGLTTAVAFVTFGLAGALPHPAAFTMGARAVLFPGAFALWPYIVWRWLRLPSRRKP
jgi:hypothetical protein